MMTYAIHEASGQDTTLQEEIAYALNEGGGKPGQGYPLVLVSEHWQRMVEHGHDCRDHTDSVRRRCAKGEPGGDR